MFFFMVFSNNSWIWSKKPVLGIWSNTQLGRQKKSTKKWAASNRKSGWLESPIRNKKSLVNFPKKNKSIKDLTVDCWHTSKGFASIRLWCFKCFEQKLRDAAFWGPIKLVPPLPCFFARAMLRTDACVASSHRALSQRDQPWSTGLGLG